MATITARLQLGKVHPHRGGICEDYNTLELYEGSNICWVAHTDTGKLIWLPRSSATTAADGLLLAAALYMPTTSAGRSISTKLLAMTATHRSQRIDLTERPDMDYETAYAQVANCMRSDIKPQYKQRKLLVSVCEGSVIHSQLSTFASLDCHVEILTTEFSKSYASAGDHESTWQRTTGRG